MLCIVILEYPEGVLEFPLSFESTTLVLWLLKLKKDHDITF